MSERSKIFDFFSLFVTYLLINFIQCKEYAPYERDVYKTASIMINPMRPATVEGTLWCGEHTQAKNYNSLGQAIETDKCCRIWHDCPDFIAPKSTKYELVNVANYRVKLCACNQAFRTCLRAVTGIEAPTARQIGLGYFEVVNPKCLLKMYYEPNCKVSYYDNWGKAYPNNPNLEYFCPILSHVPW